jgi:hypothetical protein
MELCNFKGIVYGKIQNQFFIWDSSWDSFRPIERIVWDGNKIDIIDSKFKEDLFSSYYGYGSAEMKKLCLELSNNSLDISESNIPWFTEWWRDRRCNFSECAERDTKSWLRFLKYTNSKHRTLRKHIENRATKRLIPK